MTFWRGLGLILIVLLLAFIYPAQAHEGANNTTYVKVGESVRFCDGIADDVEIQAAIDALPDTERKILLSSGHFYITKPIRLDSNMVFSGSGRDVTKLVAATNGISIVRATNKSNVTLIDIGIDGLGGTYDSNHGTKFENVTGLVVNNISVVDCALQGICGYGTTGWLRYFRITNNYAANNGHRGINLGGHAQAGIITGNILKDNGFSGISIGHGSYDIIIGENVIAGTASNHGIYINYDAARIMIKGNIIRDASACGIMLNANIREVTILGNIIDGATSDGIRIYAANQDGIFPWQQEGDTQLIIISNNSIFSSGSDGIELSSADGRVSKRVNINNNLIFANTRYGINEADATSYNTITNNQFALNALGAISLNSVSDIIQNNNGQ